MVADDELIGILSCVSSPIEFDLSTRGDHVKSAGISGQVWAKYSSIKLAGETLTKLHNFYFHGAYLSVKFELGVDPSTGKRVIASENFHSTVIRRITQRNSNNKTTVRNKHDYSGKSVVVNNTDYPFPTGLYLTRVISLCASMLFPRTEAGADNRPGAIGAGPRLNSSLMKLAVDTTLYNANSVGNNGTYAKETAEAMAMVDGLERALKHLHIRSTYCPSSSSGNNGTNAYADADTAVALPPVNVYVLGDGVFPLCAALIALHFPHRNWQYHSIDPLLQPIALSSDGDPGPTAVSVPGSGDGMPERFHQFAGLSQNYLIPVVGGGDVALSAVMKDLSVDGPSAPSPAAEDYSPPLSVVIACHSHAPLEEFWERLPRGSYKVAVTMNCCAEYCILHEPIPTPAPTESSQSPRIALAPPVDVETINSTPPTDAAESVEGVVGDEGRPRIRQQRRRQKALAARNRPVAVVPLLQYEDFEVFSPKRTVRVYAEARFS